jgi:uncharacterized protein (DUF885 family)
MNGSLACEPSTLGRMRRLLTVLFLIVVGVGGTSATPRVAAQSPQSAGMLKEGAFQGTVKRFIEEELTIYPERATALGDHRFDARVDDDSAAGIARRVSHAHRWAKIFRAFDRNSLSPNSDADREWLLANIDGELLRTESLRSYQRDPGIYLPTRAVNELIERNFAPAEVRMRSVTAREKAALANLRAATANLKADRVPQVAIDIVLQQMPATLTFFKTSIPQAFDKVPEGPDKQALREANSQVISAIDDYGRWLRTVLRPRAHGTYAIGADAFRRMIYDEDMVDTSLDKLEQIGVIELRRLQEQFAATARLVDPNHSAAEVANALGRDHPAANQVISSVEAGLGSIRAYVVSHHLVRIPSAVEPIVAETPPYMRATTFASMDSPGPFERTSEAYFYVTLPDPGWPQEKQKQLLAFYSPPNISDTSVHEVYPGHYVQFLVNRLNPDLVRRTYHSGADAEGWALYCEQMMIDAGLHNSDPIFRLAQLQAALLRACRYLAAIRMHTRGMTVAQASVFFENNAYENHHNAEVEALRGTGDPGYLRYQLGKLMILKLREDLQRKQGAAFSLGKFHNDFLSQGAIPVPLIRHAMLGASSGPVL